MDFEKFCLCCKSHNIAFIFGVVSTVAFGGLFIMTISSDMFEEKRIIGKSYIETHKTPLFWILIVESVVNFVTSIWLIVGIIKENHYMMLPWLVVIGIELIPFVLVACVGLLVAVPICGPIYIWWCTYSTYEKVIKVTDDPPSRDEPQSI